MFVSNMLTAATQVATLYIIVLVGFICSKTGLYTKDTAKKTTDLLFYIVTTVVIVRSFSHMTFTLQNARSFCIALSCNFLTMFIAMGIARLVFRKKDDDEPIFKYASVYGNAAYMALPLTQAILGDEGVFYASTGIIAFNILVFIHGVKLMTRERCRFGAKKIFLNPGIIGTVLGLPLFLTGFTLPDIVYVPIDHIASLNTPLAMLIFGTYLASTDIKSIFKEKRIYIVAAIRLIAVPLIALLLYKLIGIGGALLTSLTITAAVPSANNTILFAAKYDRDTGVASQTVAVVNVISIITLPIMIAASQSPGV